MQGTALYRQIALGDLLLFTSLAIPGLGLWLVTLLLELNARLGWPGSLAISAGVGLLISLVGLLGAALAWLRLRLGPGPQTLRVSVLVKFAAVALFVLGVCLGAPAIFLALAAADGIQALILMRFTALSEDTK